MRWATRDAAQIDIVENTKPYPETSEIIGERIHGGAVDA